MQTSDNLTINSEPHKCEINAPTRGRSRSKDELTYWKAAIRRIPNSPYWYAELQRGGIRRKVSLETSNKDAAARRAREIWYEVRALGWPGWLAKYKPESLPRANPSVGEFIEAVTRTADLAPKTLGNYLSSLRKIVADIAGLSDTTSKFGHGKGHRDWLAKVDAVRLSELSPTAIQEWKRAFLARAAQDPVSQRSARVSVNSFMRSARSLFAPRILEHLGGIELPAVLPFAGCQFESKLSSKYRSDIDIGALIEAARNELANAQPEVFKCFALAFFAGLRRKEIDLLPWSAFRWSEGVLRIEATIHFSGKSPDSLADVPLDPEVLELFRAYQASATGEFVIESNEAPRQVNYNFYRAGQHFDQLTTWLRSKGIQAKKPIHVLRKEYGSQLCQAHGIYAASRGLRHSSIAISAAFYTDSRARATVGLGHLLESKVVPFQQEVA